MPTILTRSPAKYGDEAIMAASERDPANYGDKAIRAASQGEISLAELRDHQGGQSKETFLAGKLLKEYT